MMGRSELQASHSSSGEEEVSSEGSEWESESEKTPPPPPSSRGTQATPNSSSEESESGTDAPPKKSGKPDPNINPLASKPIDDEPLKKPRPKIPTSCYSPSPLKSAIAKRPAAVVDIEAREPKRAKKMGVVAVATPGAENDRQKKQLFQRLWSEDDEIELIKGMISYFEKKGKNPIADVNDFHEFVKNSLNLDVNNAQMSAKVKRLKSKFMNNLGKIENKRKVRSFSKPHEKKMYELSKKLWGSNSNKNAVVLSCSTKKVNAKSNSNLRQRDSKSLVSSEANANGGLEVAANKVEQNVVRSGGGLGWLGVIGFPITEEEIMNKGLELVSGSKKVELEVKWNNLKVQELKHFLKKLELMQEQAELVLCAIKKSGSN